MGKRPLTDEDYDYIDELDDYDSEIDWVCPECGSENVTSFQSYENDDADGNRGEWLTFYKCKACGYVE